MDRDPRWEGRRYLVRSIETVELSEGWIDLGLQAVECWALDPMPGLLTGESASAQGLEAHLPNRPELPGGAVDTRTATLRVRAAAPGTLRLTLVPGGPWAPGADGMGDGILSNPSPGRARLSLEEEGRDVLRVRTEELELVLGRRPFRFCLVSAEGGRLCRSGGDRRQVAGFPLAAAMAFGDEWCSFSLELAPEEVVWGLGERFGSFVANGQLLELAASDAAGAGTGRIYKGAPVFHSSAGYTGFVHGPGPMVFDVGARYPSVLECVGEGRTLDLFLLGGGTMKDRLTRYTDLTGRMRVPPRWAFGVWMSRCRYATRGQLEEAAAGMRAHSIPCDVLHIDPDWLERDLLNCDFVWSEEKYPSPAEMIAGLADAGYHVSLWELPYLDPESPAYREAADAGYLVAGPAGTPAKVAGVFSRDGRARALVDFSNPDARTWWKELNRTVLDLGVSVLKCDFGEGLPDEAEMADGRSGRQWRNLYPLWYNKTVYEAIAEHTGGAALVWGRSGWAGSQRYPAQWGGDPEASVAGLAAVLRAGLSWALSAPGLWGHDIGGFYGDGPSPGLYVRWAEVGCLSPLTRFHGLTPREPWHYGDETLAIVRRFAELRYRLLPYLLSVAGEAARYGWPVMRPLCLEFPDDPGVRHVSHEYLLGGDLLVVAVLDDSEGPVDVEIVLPPGTWADFWSGQQYEGPGVFTRTVPLYELPVFVRQGAVVPMGKSGQHTGEIASDHWELHCWPGLDRTTDVYDGDLHHRYTASHSGDELVAVYCQEPVARASTAWAHTPDGTHPVALRR
ncbi:MAG: TIM-barrel domain-containing protein [Acidimicrobiales bacterium]